MEKLSTKKTEAETMREAVNLRYVGDDIKEFIVKAGKPYKEAELSDELKFCTIQKAIRYHQALMYFVPWKAMRYEQVKEACLEDADNQEMFRGRKKERTEDETEKFKVEVESLYELVSTALSGTY